MNCASFFAGAGGIDIAFENAGHTIVYANEVDAYPAKIYDANHKIKTDLRSIEDVKPEEIPKCDVYLAGFPCTDISIAGYRKGFFEEDGSYTRSGLYFELLRLIKANKPPILFLENVKNLQGHNDGKTYEIIKESLEKIGYYVTEKVLNACEYGNIPQNRERIYIVAFLDKKRFDNFKFPKKINLTTTLQDIIDFDIKVDDKYYYKDGKIAEELEKAIDDTNTVYQWRRQYVRKNMSHLIPTLTANMGTGGHNVPIVKTKFGIRKLTPRECFNAQGYPKTYILPSDIANGRLYKAAGNSVVVSVIERIAKEIK